MKKHLTLSCIALLAILIASCSKIHSKSEYSIVPMPNQIEPKSGEFTIDKNTIIAFDGSLDSAAKCVVAGFASDLSKVTGFDITVEEGDGGQNTIFFRTNADMAGEAYQLDIEQKRIDIAAADAPGFFYAIQTLKQLLPAQIYGDSAADGIEWKANCAYINDAPRFGYRGMHLDIARHMFSVDEVKSFIDLLAMHKLNRFHWHLTDDQGWRIEIKKYPELTETGAWRNETVVGHPDNNEFDGTPYGGFYTQDEIREVVKYAAERQITVVPEIDMPGHMVAAVASYPQLGCTGKQCEVRTTWGISEDVLCVGKEKTFEFVENVLTEIMELFPSEYIHIGGDECPKTRWEKCPKCQARIKEEGIKGDSLHSAETYLQSYFNNRVEKFLKEHGRKLIGWDEILEGDLSKSATVMSWRGEAGGIEAAKKGHDVIMTPQTFLYFDYYQSLDRENEPIAIGGFIPVDLVYNYNPVPDSLTPEEGERILGVQANLWTEYIPDFKQLIYMILPRLDALSEIAWTQPQNKNWDSFLDRLDKNIQVYNMKGLNYAKHLLDVNLSFEVNDSDGTIDVTLKTQGKAPIYYTLDGSTPDMSSETYSTPIKLKKTSTVKALVVRDSVESNITECEFLFNKATAKKISLDQPACVKYKYDGEKMLVDGLYGDSSFNTGRYIGFEGNDLVATIDLGKDTEISQVSVGVLCDLANWIFPAESFKVQVSADGKVYSTVSDQKLPVPAGYDGYKQERQVLTAEFAPLTARFVKITAACVKKGPQWHDGRGKPLFLFADEISIK